MEFIGGTLMEILLMSYLAGTKAIVEKYLSKMTDKKITVSYTHLTLPTNREV